MDLLTVLERAAHRNREWATRWADGSRVAARLTERGLKPGGLVLTDAADSEALNALLMGCWHLGVIPGVLPPGRGADFAEDLAADLVVAAHEMESLCAPGPSGPLYRHEATTGVLLSLTSGTTGRPKAPVLGSAAVALGTSTIADRQRLRSTDVVCCTVPQASSFQLIAALAPAAHAGCRYLSGAGLDGAALWELIRREGVTVFLGYGPVLCDLLVAWDGEPSSIRLVMSGGAPVAASVKAEFRERMGLPFVESYGQSELGGFVAMGDPLDVDPRALTHVGRALPDRPGWVDESGEIVLWGDVMVGYHRNPEATAAAKRSPGLWTGDTGTMDADGYLRVNGRIGHQLPDGRWPRDVDDQLYALAGVHHAAVIGIDGANHAFIQPRPGAVIDVDAARAATGLAGIHVVDALPRTFSGKIDRANIRLA
jgi:long-chain acyl-CoA synthetase